MNREEYLTYIKKGKISLSSYKGINNISLDCVYQTDNNGKDGHSLEFANMDYCSKGEDLNYVLNNFCELDFSHHGGGLASDYIDFKDLLNAYDQIEKFLNNSIYEVNIVCYSNNLHTKKQYKCLTMNISKFKDSYLFECDYLLPDDSFVNEYGVTFPPIIISKKEVEFVGLFFFISYLILKKKINRSKIDECLKIDYKNAIELLKNEKIYKI